MTADLKKRRASNDSFWMIAHRLWADGVFYPEYYAEYTPDPTNRFPVDYDNYETWGWSSGAFPSSNEKVFARQTRAGIPYLWVMNQIRDAATGSGDFDGDGTVTLTDYAAFYNCMSGSQTPPTPTPPATAQDCLVAFASGPDDDIDLDGLAGFQRAFENL